MNELLPTIDLLESIASDEEAVELTTTLDVMTVNLQIDAEARRCVYDRDDFQRIIYFLVGKLEVSEEENDENIGTVSSIMGLLTVIAQNQPPVKFWNALLNGSFFSIISDRWFSDEVAVFFVSALIQRRDLPLSSGETGQDGDDDGSSFFRKCIEVMDILATLSSTDRSPTIAQLVFYVTRCADVHPSTLRVFDNWTSTFFSLNVEIANNRADLTSSNQQLGRQRRRLQTNDDGSSNGNGLQLITALPPVHEACAAAMEMSFQLLAISEDMLKWPSNSTSLAGLAKMLAAEISEKERDRSNIGVLLARNNVDDSDIGLEDLETAKTVRFYCRAVSILADRCDRNTLNSQYMTDLLESILALLREYRTDLFLSTETWHWLQFQIAALIITLRQEEKSTLTPSCSSSPSSSTTAAPSIMHEEACKLIMDLAPRVISYLPKLALDNDDETSYNKNDAFPSKPDVLASSLATDLIWARRVFQLIERIDNADLISQHVFTIASVGTELLMTLAWIICSRPPTAFDPPTVTTLSSLSSGSISTATTTTATIVEEAELYTYPVDYSRSLEEQENHFMREHFQEPYLYHRRFLLLEAFCAVPSLDDVIPNDEPFSVYYHHHRHEHNKAKTESRRDFQRPRLLTPHKRLSVPRRLRRLVEAVSHDRRPFNSGEWFCSLPKESKRSAIVLCHAMPEIPQNIMERILHFAYGPLSIGHYLLATSAKARRRKRTRLSGDDGVPPLQDEMTVLLDVTLYINNKRKDLY